MWKKNCPALDVTFWTWHGPEKKKTNGQFQLIDIPNKLLFLSMISIPCIFSAEKAPVVFNDRAPKPWSASFESGAMRKNDRGAYLLIIHLIISNPAILTATYCRCSWMEMNGDDGWPTDSHPLHFVVSTGLWSVKKGIREDPTSR